MKRVCLHCTIFTFHVHQPIKSHNLSYNSSSYSRVFLFSLYNVHIGSMLVLICHIIRTGTIQRGEEGQPQQLLVRATFSSFLIRATSKSSSFQKQFLIVKSLQRKEYFWKICQRLFNLTQFIKQLVDKVINYQPATGHISREIINFNSRVIKLLYCTGVGRYSHLTTYIGKCKVFKIPSKLSKNSNKTFFGTPCL